MSRFAGPALPPTSAMRSPYDGNITGEGLPAGAVDNGAAADDRIVHWALSLDLRLAETLAAVWSTRSRQRVLQQNGNPIFANT
jgi:hypothetical protein